MAKPITSAAPEGTCPSFGSAEHRAGLMKALEVSKSGWGGILSTGEIVDRREHPEAIPIAKNSMFGVPEPNGRLEPAKRKPMTERSEQNA